LIHINSKQEPNNNTRAVRNNLPAKKETNTLKTPAREKSGRTSINSSKRGSRAATPQKSAREIAKAKAEAHLAPGRKSGLPSFQKKDEAQSAANIKKPLQRKDDKKEE
jgi:hypothetical protein